MPAPLATGDRAGLNVTRRQIRRHTRPPTWEHTWPRPPRAKSTNSSSGASGSTPSDGTYEIVNPATEECRPGTQRQRRQTPWPLPPRPRRHSRDGRPGRPTTAARSCARRRRPSGPSRPSSCRWSSPRPAPRRPSARGCRCPSPPTASSATPAIPVPCSRRRCCRKPAQATPLAPGGIIGGMVNRQADRRGGVHHVVQLPDGQHGGQGRAGPRCRQHRGGQAGAAGSAGHRRARPHPQRRRLPARRGQLGQREHTCLLRRAGRRRRRRLRELHRIDPGRRDHRREGGPDHEAHAARAGRQGCLRGLRGRRRKGRGRLHRFDVVLPLRSDLHGTDPGRGASQRLRPGARRPGADGGLPQGGRPDGHLDHHRTGHLGGAAGHGSRRTSRRRRRTAARSSLGGERPADLPVGYYVAPTLITGTTPCGSPARRSSVRSSR